MGELSMVNKVRDSIHGFIYFTDEEKEIIDWPEFQRLRHIKQLAMTN
jgi:HD superfamily phosphohydrolase